MGEVHLKLPFLSLFFKCISYGMDLHWARNNRPPVFKALDKDTEAGAYKVHLSYDCLSLGVGFLCVFCQPILHSFFLVCLFLYVIAIASGFVLMTGMGNIGSNRPAFAQRVLHGSSILHSISILPSSLYRWAGHDFQ